ncbi:MAG: Asp-tRNA(Asn)/Glu-tRNA(Gln) amidotransferase subunit GatA [Clostridia bacterium]|jgi:aspartyl-tRNA(Asn)/glutamyl-tRNA(Gln) amidotransferase subunit A
MHHYMTAHQLAEEIRKGNTSASEIARSTMERIERLDPEIGAYITTTGDRVLEAANRVDERLAKGEAVPPLAGIPMAIMDNICTQGILTTCASRMLHNFIPPYSADAYERLERAGSVLTGKTNLDEFAMGSSTQGSAFKKTYNPWDLGKVPGGSGGGAAAAVAAGMAAFALGTDTDGSIRQPAALCGVVGMKPTYGRISRHGLVAFASSMDQAGVVTRDVRDCALVLNHICGHDRRDSMSANVAVPDFRAGLGEGIKGFKIGIPSEYFGEGTDQGIKERVKEAVKALEGLGAICDEVSLPHTGYALSAYYIISSAEASSNLARYDGIRYGYKAEDYTDLEELFVKSRSQGFGEEVKRRVIMGTYFLTSGKLDAYFKKAQKLRALVKADFDRVFGDYDLLVCPTSPVVAYSDEPAGKGDDHPLSTCLPHIFTIPASLAGLPALSIPCGFSKGLPVGLQLIGKPFGEEALLRAAYAYEQSTEFHTMHPQV